MKTFRNLVCLSLMAAVACSAVADEKEKKGKGKKGARKAPSATQQLLSKIELDDEQKTAVAAIDKQFAEKFTAIRQAVSDVLTDGQKKTQRTMQKAAREAGKKPQESRKEIEAALKLSDEQKAKQKAAQANKQKLNAEIIAALKKILTEEQQAKLPKLRTGRKKKKNAA